MENPLRTATKTEWKAPSKSQINEEEISSVKHLFIANKWVYRRRLTGETRKGGKRGGIRSTDRICQAMKKYRWLSQTKDECIGTMSTATLFFSLSLSLFSCTLTPNFPHFNPNLTDSPTVRLEYTERTRISAFPWDCLVRGKAPGTKFAECTSISWFFHRGFCGLPVIF